MEKRLTRREPDRLAEVLRREAAGERPMFSEALHGWILRVMPVKPAAPAVIPLAEPRAEGTGRSAWRQASLAAAGAALIVALAIVGAGHGPAGGPPRSVALATTDPSGGAEMAAAGEAAEFGIDRVPTFDELDAGVREGVSTLAATLLDVPDWRLLADFDAAGFLGREAAR